MTVARVITYRVSEATFKIFILIRL